MSDNKFKLSKPLLTHSGELSELTLTEPTARLFVANGSPFTVINKINPDGSQTISVDYDDAKMVKFLAGMIEPKVDDLIINNVRGVDYIKLRERVVGQLLELAGTNPSQPSAA
jgi:hypothetical protein